MGKPSSFFWQRPTYKMWKAAIEVFGEISEAQALAIGSANLEKMLGVEEVNSDLVATQAGSLLDASSRVVAIISSRKEIVDVL
jgi:hypothetical protein